MRYITAVMALFSTIIVRAQDYDSPRTTQIDRDDARSGIVAYPTQEEALRFGHAPSRYLRPIGEWQEGSSELGRTFTGEFNMPFAWIDRELFLYVGPCGSGYEVTVNGRRAGYVQHGNTPAEYDITKLAVEGKNRVTVTMLVPSTSEALETAPTKDPVPGECYVLAQPKMRVRDILVRSTISNDDNGVLELGVVIKTHALNPKTTRVYYEVLAPDTTKVVEGYKDLTLDMRREDTVRFMATIPRSMMWSAETPNLYTVIVRTRYEGRINEYIPLKVGFRTVTNDNGTLLINGKPVTLRVKEGSSEYTIPELETFKKLGYNTLRMQPGILSQAQLDRCDSVGFYVIDQIPIDTNRAGLSRKRGGNPSNDPAWRDAYLDRSVQHYLAVRNHPSVVAFSLARESANGINLYESYLRLKELEKERPVIYPESGGEWNSDPLNLP